MSHSPSLKKNLRNIQPSLSHGIENGLVVRKSPAMQKIQEMQVRSLGQEDLLEEGMATRSSILAWRIPWTEEPGGQQGHKESDTTERLSLFTFLNCL